MPAYFNVSLQFKREDIYSNFMNDFYIALDIAGLKFLHGCDNEISQKQIVEWNQHKIEQNFVLGFTEHRSHDYKQSVFYFKNYSEIRGFWLNNYPEDNTFCYEIIIPESDVLVSECDTIFQQQKINELLELSKKIWQFPYIKVIQTGLEENDASTRLSKIEQGEYPNISPFAIVEKENIQFINSEYYVNQFLGDRNGILLILPSVSKKIIL
ncbi:hypothetical protein [Clostridium sp. MD294]|uniref:hypothetical protein n=1 Tax=Clostridium sp. MD294 TaxID=97138 RepID=UPI0002CC925F|nr:hypothetical protein [Clostridium sp. MD294]NDO45615.1 hypothetical protein [Clostridium sp. MD294]USF30731.1 hypothetical protein C820_002174 [Clostridium sp. MD294]